MSRIAAAKRNKQEKEPRWREALSERCAMTTPSITTFTITDNAVIRDRFTDANPNYRDLGVVAETLEQWDQEAADIRRYARTVAPFDPYPDLPKPVVYQRPRAACPDSSIERTRNRATGTFCHRARRRWVADAETGEPVAVFPPCDSRTCRDCRPRLDYADADRISAAIGERAYLSEIAAEDRETVAKRMRRHAATGAFVPSSRDPSRLIVIADEPVTPEAVRVSDAPSVVLDLMLTRPTGQARRLTTFGDVESRRAWEGRPTAETLEGPSESMAPTVQPADIERVAAALGLPFETVETRKGSAVRLRCRWDDYRAVTLRRWSRNPAGEQWEQTYLETLIAEGVYEAEPPPLAAYPEAVA